MLVVSAMPATIYRSIMKALDAWDYLQKTTFEESDFVDTFLEILRASRCTARAGGKGTRSERRRTVSGPAASGLATLARATHQPATDRTAHSRRAA